MSSNVQRLPNRDTALKALYDDVFTKHMFPFWATSTEVDHDEVKQLLASPKAVPYLWSCATDIEPILHRAVEPTGLILHRHPPAASEYVRRSAVGRVALTGELVHLPDVLADPDIQKLAAQLGDFRAVLSVPLVREDEAVVGHQCHRFRKAEPCQPGFARSDRGSVVERCSGDAF